MTPNVAAPVQKHCPGCFQLKGDVPVCRHCGYDDAAPRSPLFLPHGVMLGGQYRVGRVLGRPGGFGITYLGWDVNLQQRVAIKEYLPREIAQRMPNALAVHVHTRDDQQGFEFGKEQFLREARIVAQLDHPNIVRLRNFFNANATAYLVMDYYEGMSLGDYLATVRSTLEPELAVALLKPILEGLHYVHERSLVHRDLKPHNIYLAAIGRPIVLDFGAARQATGDRVQSLSVVLTEGYAPLEQYQRRAVQGPWTDVYGSAATLYRMLTGVAPPIALDRIGRDPLEDGGWATLPPGLVPALRKALAVRPADRYQSAAEFRAALDRYISGSQSQSATTPTVASIIPAPTPFTPPLAEPVPTLILPPRTAAAEVRINASLPDRQVDVNLCDQDDRAVAELPQRSALRWLPWMLLLLASAAVAYVLLRPLLREPDGRQVLPTVKPLLQRAAAAQPEPQLVRAAIQIPALVLLPAGSLALRESDATAAVRSVAMAPLKMGRSEVSVAEFRDFVQRSGYDNPRWQNYPCESPAGGLPDWQAPGYTQGEDSPVVCVSWVDASAYAQWLSRETGRQLRLPTEAEWEYAARAGRDSRYWWGDALEPGRAVCQNCAAQAPLQAAAAAASAANGFGLHDTLGNVREWTCSAYSPYSSGEAERCGSLPEGGRVAVRGGSWQQDAETLAANYREGYEPYRRNVWTGFRVMEVLP